MKTQIKIKEKTILKLCVQCVWSFWSYFEIFLFYMQQFLNILVVVNNNL